MPTIGRSQILSATTRVGRALASRETAEPVTVRQWGTFCKSIFDAIVADPVFVLFVRKMWNGENDDPLGCVLVELCECIAIAEIWDDGTDDNPSLFISFCRDSIAAVKALVSRIEDLLEEGIHH
jgi:hypothetical protein